MGGCASRAVRSQIREDPALSPQVIEHLTISQMDLHSFPDSAHGNVVWKTVFSSPATPTDSMCAGIATCPPGGHLALHQHAPAEMYYILAGSGNVEVNGVANHVSAGTVLWIPGDAMHGVFCGPKETLEWLYVFPEAQFKNIVYRFKGAEMIIDADAPSIPQDASRVLQLLASATPGFTKDSAVLDAVTFEGMKKPIGPGLLMTPVIAAALHGMCGIVANEILDPRDGQRSDPRVAVNTDHAAFWLGSVDMSRRNGSTVRELAKNGKLGSIFPKDIEKDTFATPL
ncbi:hypothetical protein QQS21_008675 [Conoideocrella luteorostrata]|uniref:Cupin type-2 domain-containing protein n=1 Tax=Conoideocrella luteorostrata TaxID=1105319 RepID=A0AAJ0CJA8_9HYPO|nr:hypothetical protein QQS21_008675 [Conoideocrella luteorostrata]